jgi:uncharacterized protein YfaP (DUF2135 family)
VIISALVITIFLTTINIANADSFPFSSLLQSRVKSQPPPQQQHHLDINGTMMTRNPNEQQIMHQPFSFSPQSPPLQLQPQQPSQQQQENQQPTQQPLDTNGMSNSHNNKSDNHLPSTISLLPF